MKITKLIVTAALVAATVIPVSANEWKQDATGWWYEHSDGSYTRNAWESVNGVWYAFDNNGYMRTGWFQDGGKWYYLDVSGVMKTGWLQDVGKWYYLNADGSMAANTTVEGYRIGVDGVMIEETRKETNVQSTISIENEVDKELAAKDIEDVLTEINNWYIGDIWNNFVDFDAYRKYGKDCTGSDIDIEFAYKGFQEAYKLKDKYNSYIVSLPDNYSNLKEVWGKMNEQIELIYQDLETNGLKEGMSGLKISLLGQYSNRFYEYIN